MQDNSTNEMRKPLLFILLIWASFAFAQKRGEELRGIAADKVFKGASLVWQKQSNLIPSFIELRQGQDEESFLAGLKSQFQLPSAYSFTLSSTDADQIGWLHKRYSLTVNGVPLVNGSIVLHIKNGKVFKYNGYVFKNVNAPSTASISEADALTAALADVGATSYKWQIPAEEKFIKAEQHNAQATFYPKGALCVLQLGGNESNEFKLAYKFDVYAHEPMERFDVYIDAATGVVLQKLSHICTAHEQGTAVTGFSGVRNINTDSYAGAYRLRDNIRGINTYNLQNTANYGAAVDFTDADNYWNNINAAKDQYATDAHFGAALTYDMYQSLGRNSLDNNGYPLNLYMHYNTNYLNAFWDGSRMVFGDGNSFYKPFAPLDITGHEISHGLTERSAGLIYQGESGALNESFSDIFGLCVEWQGDSLNANWLIGEKIGFIFRSMSNPNAYDDPDTYLGTYWYTGTGDFGGVHTNSGVQNYWFYLLAQGGSGTNDRGNAFNVLGIGREAAKQIAWRNLVYYLTASSDFEDARFYSIQAAVDLYGLCSPQVVAVTKAWYAVGVGANYVSNADAQFTAPIVSTCSAPVAVSFTNASVNTSNYLWKFGDGTTSTSENPTHTYASNGNYSVTLIASGACGADTVVVSNLVNINPANPCAVTVPTVGTAQVQTSCSGTVYDDGGIGANYSNNVNSTVVIAPVGAARVVLHFTQFSMEDDNDRLYIYDGASVLSPILAVLSGNAIPTDVVSNSPVVTIRQQTNGSVSAAGFALQWSCVQPNALPQVNFAVDNASSCSGAVQFSNLTANGATSYLWNFGDGSTSTQANPLHQYVQNGSYTVTLSATNSMGTNVAIKTSYIHINKPAAPYAYTTTSCGPSEVTAVAATSNRVRWYDASGVQVCTTANYTTPLLQATTAYYVEEVIPQPIANVGPASSNIGAGEFYNGNANRALRFNVSRASVLKSVLVIAQGAGSRTIQYRNAEGAVLQQQEVYCEHGQNRIELNFDLIPGEGYELGVAGNYFNLYKNNSGAVYPYNDANGIVSITGNNVANAASQYYYFYDWEVHEHECVSERGVVPMYISPAVNANVVANAPSCYGMANGSANVNVAAGSPPYYYRWSNLNTDSAISNLSSGEYSVTVIDAEGCMYETSVTLTEPTQVLAEAIAKPDTCMRHVGQIALTISGGTPPYTQSWNSPQSALGNSGYAAGSYAINISDSKGCTAAVSAVVDNVASLGITTIATSPRCYGDKDASIKVQANSGTLPYSYIWSNGSHNEVLQDVNGGTYNVTVSDANQCSATASATIVAPAELSANATIRHLSCYRSNDGAIEVHSEGGTGAHIYRWADGTNTNNAINLAGGIYVLTVSDANGCLLTVSSVVNEPREIQFATATMYATNGNDGKAILSNLSGGTAPYNIVWSSGQTGAQANDLAEGRYGVSVTDAKQCFKESSVSIMQLTTGIGNVSDEVLLSAYPNPASVEVTITTSNLKGAAKLTLTNALGQLLIDEEVDELTLLRKISVAQLAQGTYIIELKNDDIHVVKELVVVR